MNDQSGDRLFAIVNVILILALFVIAWQVMGHEIVPGVVVHDIGSCALDWHRESSALVVACPGQDMVRVWPLPVVAPWLEDTTPPNLSPITHMIFDPAKVAPVARTTRTR